MKKLDYMTGYLFLIASAQIFTSLSVMAKNEIIEKLDLDKDGQITIKEAVAEPSILATFGKIDSDGNGKISKTELSRAKIVVSEQATDIESG